MHACKGSLKIILLFCTYRAWAGDTEVTVNFDPQVRWLKARQRQSQIYSELPTEFDGAGIKTLSTTSLKSGDAGFTSR